MKSRIRPMYVLVSLRGDDGPRFDSPPLFSSFNKLHLPSILYLRRAYAVPTVSRPASNWQTLRDPPAANYNQMRTGVDPLSWPNSLRDCARRERPGQSRSERSLTGHPIRSEEHTSELQSPC